MVELTNVLERLGEDVTRYKGKDSSVEMNRLIEADVCKCAGGPFCAAAAGSSTTLSLQTIILPPRRTFGLAIKLKVDYIVSSTYVRVLRVL